MIKHIVMFKFLDEAQGHTKAENIQTAKSMMEALRHSVPTVRKLKVELNDKNAKAENFDLALIAEYDSLEDLHAYQIHPEHKKLSAFMGKVREQRACIDYEF